MTASGGGDDFEATELTEERRELLEEIASWDEETYPLAKHAQRILRNLKEESE